MALACAGVFVAFIYLIGRGHGIPWIGGKLGTRTGKLTLGANLKFGVAVIIAFPVYSVAAYLISDNFYEATGGRQFFLSSIASMQLFVGRGILV